MGFVKQFTQFPKAFYTANLMEIFERMAWYGFYAVSSLYLTGPVSEGCLGFTSEQRGVIQAIIPFILYLLPIFTGALADQFGYKRTFATAYAILTPGYFLLGQPTGFIGFLFVFLLVAIGAALFKPVVVATISRVTTEENSSLGFGIFYMMVNIGGFLGPVVAGMVRTNLGWDWVFKMSSLWIGLNFIWLFLMYEEPSSGEAVKVKGKLTKALSDMCEVIGNLRFFVLVFGILFSLMLAGGDWITWSSFGIFSVVWVGLNLLADVFLRQKGLGEKRELLAPVLQIGDKKFLIYLLLLSGFWTEFNQLFITLPEYIRDFTDTTDILRSIGTFAGSIGWTSLADSMSRLISEGYQINPEYLINIDAGMIIFIQVLISTICMRYKPFTTMIVGTLFTAVAMFLGIYGTSGWMIILFIAVFAVGEMMASPKSQEYVSLIAPKEKAAMYMGYYFVSIALGNIFGGILSGQAYGKLARDMQRPDLMWIMFGVIAIGTAVLLWLYNAFYARKRAE